MPTPKVAHEARRDRIAPSPVVTMPISDQHEAGQPVEDNVPTGEVDLEQMVDKNCGRHGKNMTRTKSNSNL